MRGRLVVAATHNKMVLLLSWLGPVTVAGSLGTPVLTIGARPAIKCVLSNLWAPQHDPACADVRVPLPM